MNAQEVGCTTGPTMGSVAVRRAAGTLRVEVALIRSALKRGIKKAFGLEPSPAAAPAPAPVWRTEPVTAAPVAAVAAVPVAPVGPVAVAAPTELLAAEVPAGALASAEPPVHVADDPPAAPTAMAPTDDTAGAAFTFAAVQEIMDEMVRPALQGDGGDITLLRIENNDIYVKLVGSCSTCPSSILTMKMGVEALLKEEFPAMNSLIQVD